MLSEQQSYVQALCKEIINGGPFLEEYEVSSIFFGGGTPSLLPVTQTKDIMQALYKTAVLAKDCEITMECNPKTVTKDKLKAYYELGINRLSFGLQSTDTKELTLLGRIHTYQDFLDNYEAARHSGFTNINIDLMSGLPYQTMKTYEKSLKEVLALQPEHISAYSLIVEEGTKFYEWFGPGAKDEKALPDEALDRSMYQHTKQILRQQGYERYEFSNYAKPGYACRHNVGYWTGCEYLGFGLGAASYYKGKRFHNVTDHHQYMEAIKNNATTHREITILTKQQMMEEFMFLGLRMCCGVRSLDFETKFQKKITEVYQQVIPKLMEEKVLKQTAEGYALTDYGIDVSNVVLSEFLL